MDGVTEAIYWKERGVDMSKRLRCKDCENSDKYSYEYPCSTCYSYENFKEKKSMSNADKIRSMSDEELADYIFGVWKEAHRALFVLWIAIFAKLLLNSARRKLLTGLNPLQPIREEVRRWL